MHTAGTKGNPLASSKRDGCNQRFEHLARHVDEAEIMSLVSIGEPLAVQSKAVQRCGMRVVNVNVLLAKLR